MKLDFGGVRKKRFSTSGFVCGRDPLQIRTFWSACLWGRGRPGAKPNDRFCEFRFGPDRPSPPRAGAGEQDIGADNKPKGVLADDRDVDKDANDRKDCHQERGDKSKPHVCPQFTGAWSPHAAHNHRSVHITVLHTTAGTAPSNQR
jgi:hypothetical protein